jgi:hypothetical protein
MSWLGYRDITRPKFVYCAVIHHYSKVTGNDVGKMRSLATLCTRNGFHMLRPFQPGSQVILTIDISPNLTISIKAFGGLRVSSGALKFFVCDVNWVVDIVILPLSFVISSLKSVEPLP